MVTFDSFYKFIKIFKKPFFIRIDIVHKVNYELTWWKKCDSKQKSNEEYMVQVYKPLKRLISAFEKKAMEIEQEKQFMS